MMKKNLYICERKKPPIPPKGGKSDASFKGPNRTLYRTLSDASDDLKETVSSVLLCSCSMG